MITEDDVLESGDMVAAAILLAGRAIAYQLKYLGNGDASTPMGAIEAYGKLIGEKLDVLTNVLETGLDN